MKRSKTVEILQDEISCVKRACDCNRDCSKCDLVKDDKEIVDAFQTAIRSMKAWGYVMEEIKKHCGCSTALDIVKDHLKKVEEGYE